MKKILIIVLLVVTLLVCIGLIGHSHTYLIDINNLYKLKYGIKVVPVIEQLCVIEGIDYLYLYFPELINMKGMVKNSILIYVPPLRATALGSEVNYTDVFLLTGYITIQRDP